ncbi:hypothetical protein SKAU_G00243480 [Synaphobranchus kaupii]|uniref:Uncharacterized protein n=1 Tax=Synaphobranchus kaupii TaxID=118154 RepID=A0A9Q1IU46_SYNKA|nr:hypothetical protein SKAU_G00243480 [Synaphobranchus kaupii]
MRQGEHGLAGSNRQVDRSLGVAWHGAVREDVDESGEAHLQSDRCVGQSFSTCTPLNIQQFLHWEQE